MAWGKSTKQRRAMRRHREALDGWFSGYTVTHYDYPPLPEHPTLRDVVESAYSATIRITTHDRHGRQIDSRRIR